MKNLKDMSIVEILDELGICIYSPDVSIFIDKKGAKEDLEDRLKSKKDNKEIGEIFIKFFTENEEYIDKEKFLLIELYRMSKLLEENKVPEEELKTKMNKANKMLKGCKSSIIIIEDGRPKVVNLDTIQGKKTSNKNYERLQAIAQELPIRVIVASIHLSDIENLICTEQGLGEQLVAHVINKVFSEEERNNLNNENEKIDSYAKAEEYNKRLISELQNIILNYSEYISIDKLLLTAIYRHLEASDNSPNTKGPNYKVQDLLKEMYSFVNEKVQLKGKIRITELDKKDSIKDIDISYNAKEFKEMIYNGFINGRYIGEKTKQKIRDKILNENSLLEEFDPRVIKALKIDLDELMILINNDTNLKYLLSYDMINDELLKYILYNKENISSDILGHLLEIGKIDNQAMLNLYNDEVITLTNIQELKEKENLNLEEIASEEKLIRLYKEFNKCGECEEFVKYLPLFKELKIKDAELENKKEIGQRLIEELDGDFEEEDLKKMYGLGMIPVETAIEWGGKSITQDMFNEGILKPIDAKRLYKNNTLSIDMIKQVLKSSQLSEEDKLTLICSTFDSDEDSKTRMELIQCLDVDNKENKRNLNKNESKKISIGFGSSTSKNAYITDPCMRWKLISLLDEEYSQEVCKDGYIIFKLPNVKNGTVIIEKMFKKSPNGVIPSYGNATYILSEEQFDKSENDIVDSNNMLKTINLSELAELRGEEKADKLNHSSKWGNNIKEYFDVEKEESMYDKEKIEQIDKTIESIENSRTLK